MVGDGWVYITVRSLCNVIYSSAPDKSDGSFTSVFFKLILWIDILNISHEIKSTLQDGKLNFWSTHPKTDVPYMFYTKYHSARWIFYSPNSKCTFIGERASISFPHCIGSGNGLVSDGQALSHSLSLCWPACEAIWRHSATMRSLFLICSGMTVPWIGLNN